jgi:hypothetical protein
MSLICGIVDSFLSHPSVTFTLFNRDEVVSTDRGRWVARSDVPVLEYEELAIMGAAEYPAEPGESFTREYPSHGLLRILLIIIES